MSVDKTQKSDEALPMFSNWQPFLKGLSSSGEIQKRRVTDPDKFSKDQFLKQNINVVGPDIEKINKRVQGNLGYTQYDVNVIEDQKNSNRRNWSTVPTNSQAHLNSRIPHDPIWTSNNDYSSLNIWKSGINNNNQGQQNNSNNNYQKKTRTHARNLSTPVLSPPNFERGYDFMNNNNNNNNQWKFGDFQANQDNKSDQQQQQQQQQQQINVDNKWRRNTHNNSSTSTNNGQQEKIQKILTKFHHKFKGKDAFKICPICFNPNHQGNMGFLAVFSCKNPQCYHYVHHRCLQSLNQSTQGHHQRSQSHSSFQFNGSNGNGNSKWFNNVQKQKLPSNNSLTKQFGSPSKPKHKKSSSSSTIDTAALKQILNDAQNEGPDSSVIQDYMPFVQGKIAEIAKNQCGSRFLQTILQKDQNRKYLNMIYDEIYDDLPDLFVDLFGNYLCQKIIEGCSDKQRYRMLERISPQVKKIACDRQGTRAIQTLVKLSKKQGERVLIIKAISKHVLCLVRDPNGSHVIHAILDTFPVDMVKIVFAICLHSCRDLAINQHGCIILKKCLSLTAGDEYNGLAFRILEHVLYFVNDQYGNYLVQHLIQTGQNKIVIQRLHQQLRSHYAKLSGQKFSSNVVEKCLRSSDVKWRAAIIQELVSKDSISALLEDCYGNYVMQNALYVADRKQAKLLIEVIRPRLDSLRKNIQKKWERLLINANAKINVNPRNKGRKPKKTLKKN